MHDGRDADTNGRAPTVGDALADVVYGVGGRRPFMTLPGVGGVPHRTTSAYSAYGAGSPPLKRGGQLHCEIYDVGDEKQREAYEKSFSRVYTLINAGKAFIVSIDRRFVAERCAWLVCFEWVELFTYDIAHSSAPQATARSDRALKPVRETVGSSELHQERADDATRSTENC